VRPGHEAVQKYATGLLAEWLVETDTVAGAAPATGFGAPDGPEETVMTLAGAVETTRS